MEIKQLEILEEKNWLKRVLWSRHAKKTYKYVLIGGIISALFYYITEGRLMDSFSVVDTLKSFAIGSLLGLFITNSPCARGKC